MNLIDYHTHTELCGHASGTTDDYVQEAIKKNLLEIGFSDHAPLPEGLREGITMLPEETEHYIALIEEKKKKYQDKIKVKIGFEIDFPLTETFDNKFLQDPRLDYLIGSCHFLGDWAFDHPDHKDEFNNRNINDVYNQYYEIIGDMIETGYFNIVGHFDLVKKFGHRAEFDFTKKLENLAYSIAKKKNIAVEINTAGLRKPVKEIYPSIDIIEIFYRMNTPVTLGSDAHKPEEVGYLFANATEIIKKVGYRKISGFAKRQRYDIVF
jgi:histidinol-phosphatase (PHP family)